MPECPWNANNLACVNTSGVLANAKYESNQDFSETQLAYGLDGTYAIRGNQPEHWLSRWNVFDCPFALLRLLLDTDEEYRGETFSRGTALPSLQLGLDLVDPTDNSAREALGEDDPFPRFRSKIEVNSLVGRYEGTELRGRMGWRFFSELGAPSAIEDADLDEFSYFYVALDLPKGWFVSYSTGELPLDVDDDDVFELGFRYVQK